jgi:hypothetical protein
MPLGVHELEIEEKVVGQRRQFPEYLRLYVTAGVEDHREFSFLTPVEEGPKEVRLEERLATREGDTASGFIEVDPVVFQKVQNLLHRPRLAHQLQGSGDTHLHAGGGQIAPVPGDHDRFPFQADGLAGARWNAITT